jgi:hypothetical protein
MLISRTPPSKPSCKFKLLRKVICTGVPPWLKKIIGERSCLSLTVGGSSLNAALGTVSAVGVGTPELDVAHVMLDQPGGSAGGVTLSKFSVARVTGPHGGPSWLPWLLKIDKAVAASATTATVPLANVMVRPIASFISLQCGIGRGAGVAHRRRSCVSIEPISMRGPNTRRKQGPR